MKKSVKTSGKIGVTKRRRRWLKPVALLSVYDKGGIVEFAKALINLGWEIIASGGTCKVLKEANLQATDVAEIVGGGAILGHRVVTLSREIHAGLLSTDSEEDKKELQRMGIPRIDLVCVDLYPLIEEIQNPEATTESVLNKTDIGGPAILRSAAKGQRIVICDPADCERVLSWLEMGSPYQGPLVQELAAKAEGVVADYCLASARFHSQGKIDGMVGTLVKECKYGENPWQKPAGLYKVSDDSLAIHNFKQIQGTDPSFINLTDLDRGLQTLSHISAALNQNGFMSKYIAVGLKHGNPCGAALGEFPLEVIERMLSGDLRAIFGGTVILNFDVDEGAAFTLRRYAMPEGKKRLLDCIIAPSFNQEVLDELARKGDKCRLFANPEMHHYGLLLDKAYRLRPVRGGFLRQQNYNYVLSLEDILPSYSGYKSETSPDMLLAWAVGSTSNSNTITLVRDRYVLANAVGQQDRVMAAKLAVLRAREGGHFCKGAVAYSDSFFPFPDAPKVLIDAGVRAILTSCGSVNDEATMNLCRGSQTPLFMVPDVKARGFFGH